MTYDGSSSPRLGDGKGHFFDTQLEEKTVRLQIPTLERCKMLTFAHSDHNAGTRTLRHQQISTCIVAPDISAGLGNVDTVLARMLCVPSRNLVVQRGKVVFRHASDM